MPKLIIPEITKKPYLIRAIYEWLAAQNDEPQVLLKTDVAGVVIPSAFYKDPTLVLNIAMRATTNLVLDNNGITFGCRIARVHCDIQLPMESIIAIYGRDSGQGTHFPEVANDLKVTSNDNVNEPIPQDEKKAEPPKEPDPTKPTEPRTRGHLRVIK
jgi:stringent starvation protein B